MDGVVERLSVTPPAAAEPIPAAVVVKETANGGVTVSRAEATTAPEGEKLILGKFKDQAALEKAYGELEKKLGAPKTETPAATPAPTTDAAAAATKAGLDLKSLGDEYTTNGGKLSDASMAKLAAAGVTAEQVTQYIAGQEAIAKQIHTDLATAAGGAEKLDSLLEWAKTNASEDQKAAFDAALDSGNPALVKLALKGIQTDYVTAVGNDPALVKAETTPASSGVQPFSSTQELTAAMGDARYKKGDRAYIKSVADRLKISHLWGRRG